MGMVLQVAQQSFMGGLRGRAIGGVVGALGDTILECLVKENPSMDQAIRRGLYNGGQIGEMAGCVTDARDAIFSQAGLIER